jgi:CBS domain containing-hemolysin-like protein
MTGWFLAASVLLLILNAVFVAVEFSLVAARRTRLEQQAQGGDHRAQRVLAAQRDLSRWLTGCQLAITMCSVGLGAVAEPSVVDVLKPPLGWIGPLPDGAVHGVAFGLALAIVVFLHLVLAEMVPKYTAIAVPEPILLWTVRPIGAFMQLFRPLIWLLNVFAGGLLRLVGVERRDELAMVHTVGEISDMLAASREEGLIEAVAHDLLSGALDFGEKPIASVMVPRQDVLAVTRDAPVSAAEDVVVESGHSRIPVLGRDIDDVVGFVHAKDLLTLPPDAQDRPVPQSRIRPILTVSVGDPLDDVLVAMRRARSHVAVVLDEHGRTAGIATLEDLLEALVGDIRDESDAGLRRLRTRPRRR